MRLTKARRKNRETEKLGNIRKQKQASNKLTNLDMVELLRNNALGFSGHARSPIFVLVDG
jgi:hypothetical protein